MRTRASERRMRFDVAMRTVCWIWIALSSFLPMATMAGVAAAEEPPVAADEPLTLELEVACHDTALHQQFIVAEGADFHLVTELRGLRWTISGGLGRVTDLAIPVTLHVEASGPAGLRLDGGAAVPRQLRVNEFRDADESAGLLTVRLWLHRGLDPAPALVPGHGLARRPLTGLLRDDDAHVRIAAARSLLHAGRDQVALDCLEDLVASAKDASVRRYAKEIAYRIRDSIRLDDRRRALR